MISYRGSVTPGDFRKSGCGSDWNVLSKVIMQRTAGCIMRWSSNTWRGESSHRLFLCIWMRMKGSGAEGGRGGKNADAAHLLCEAIADKRNGAALDLRAGVFTRVGINVNVEGLDGICLAFYRLCIILQRVFFGSNSSLTSARRHVAPRRLQMKFCRMCRLRDREAKQIECGVGFQTRALICHTAAPWKVVEDSLFLPQLQQTLI